MKKIALLISSFALAGFMLSSLGQTSIDKFKEDSKVEAAWPTAEERNNSATNKNPSKTGTIGSGGSGTPLNASDSKTPTNDPTSKSETEGKENEIAKPQTNWKSISEGLNETNRSNATYNWSESAIKKTPVPNKLYPMNAYSFGKKEKRFLITDVPKETSEELVEEVYQEDSEAINTTQDAYNQNEQYSSQEGMYLDNQYNNQSTSDSE